MAYSYRQVGDYTSAIGLLLGHGDSRIIKYVNLSIREGLSYNITI